MITPAAGLPGGLYIRSFCKQRLQVFTRVFRSTRGTGLEVAQLSLAGFIECGLLGDGQRDVLIHRYAVALCQPPDALFQRNR